MADFIQRLANMPDEKRSYLLENLPSHLVEASDLERWRTLLISVEFIQSKIIRFDTQALVADYELAPCHAPNELALPHLW